MSNKSDHYSRRDFLRTSGFALAAFATRGVAHATEPTPALDVETLAKFADPLPIPTVISPAGTRPSLDSSRQPLSYYRIAMREIRAKVHRDLPPTRLWGFANSSPGPTIEARSGKGVLVEWANELPHEHFLPIDHTIHGAEASKPDVRVVTHLHGAKAPAASDGYPEDWFIPGKSVVYHYPNQQEAAQLWYHDHALGITRLNVYAGLVGNYILRDEFEDGLNLPKGKHEIPLTIYDRFFDRAGQLVYPTSDDPQSPWISELFGDAILVNGKLFPYLEVEPRKYRFRVLNAANARFLHLTLSNEQEFSQIGTDLGLLPSPARFKTLQLAPGERADLILDFSQHAGENITMMNQLITVMQFRVAKAAVKDQSALPSTLRTVTKIPEQSAVRTRILTVGEQDDMRGMPKRMLLNNAHWNMPITENPVLDSVEIWSLLNFTDDSHPIHLHAVRFQILDRRTFVPELYYHGGQIKYIGDPVPPTANESGWKDTVQAHPGMVTRIIVRFEGYTGKFVWHCHILEHEDNEMMRPYEIVAK